MHIKVHASLEPPNQGCHQISIHHIDFQRFGAVDAFARKPFQPGGHLSMRVDCDPSRRVAGFMQSRCLRTVNTYIVAFNAMRAWYYLGSPALAPVRGRLKDPS
jgi:hypothetical protein